MQIRGTSSGPFANLNWIHRALSLHNAHINNFLALSLSLVKFESADHPRATIKGSVLSKHGHGSLDLFQRRVGLERLRQRSCIVEAKLFVGQTARQC